METPKKVKRKSRNASHARTRLVDILNAKMFYQQTSENITDAVIKLREEFNLPSYEWMYLSGYGDAIRQGWYHRNLVYCVEWQGKPIPMKWDEIPEDLREWCRKGLPYTSGHYWQNKDGSIGKPFFTSIVNDPKDKV